MTLKPKHNPEESGPKKARQIRPNVNVWFTVFFDRNGMMRHEFLSQGHTINNEFVRTAQNCGKTHCEFCTMTTHQLKIA